MQTIYRDLKFGLRSLLKDKGFSMTVVLTLALCIGANTAIFAIVHSVLLRPLPVPRAEEILLMANQYPNAGRPDPRIAAQPIITIASKRSPFFNNRRCLISGTRPSI